MLPRVTRAVCAVSLGYALLLVPVLCADDDEKTTDKTSAKPTPQKAPDWSKYTTVTDIVGEIVRADANKLVLRVTWLVPQNSGNNRPHLSGNHRNFHNPHAAHMTRPPQLKEQHHDYELEFVPESLVRLKKLPPKTDETGKKVNYTTKELAELRAPDTVSGYAATVVDLVPGTIVDVTIVRDKSIPAAKATEDDLRVKYAMVLGKDPNPPKDIANQKTPPKKKN